MLSFAVHGVFFMSLAAVTYTVAEPVKVLELMMSAEPVALDDELPLPDVELPAEGDVDALATEQSADLLDAGQTSLGDLLAESELDQLGRGDIAAGEGSGAGRSPGSGMGDVGALFGGSGRGLGASGSGQGAGALGATPSAEFFGAKIDGRRIVFVLDNSGSMQGGRLETVIAELLRCVDSLEPDQEFYVIFHSDTVYPLFYPQPVDRFIRPTDQNKRRLANWLDTVELCLGDSVDEAVAIAAMIEPDTVFLLSDGLIHGDRTMGFLLASQTRNFPIHTFAVGLGASPAGRKNLEDIAAANGGKFQVGDVPAEMRDLARREPRPYHTDGPGAVWGPKVKVKR